MVENENLLNADMEPMLEEIQQFRSQNFEMMNRDLLALSKRN